MYKADILAQIEAIINNPATSKEDKAALQEGYKMIDHAMTPEEVIKAIEFLAAILAIIHFILAVSS